jgi:hypothetical protein
MAGCGGGRDRMVGGAVEGGGDSRVEGGETNAGYEAVSLVFQ